MGAERVDQRGWERIHAALAAGDPDDALAAAWTGKEKVRNVYLTDDLDEATAALDDAIAWCSDPDSGPELARLLKTLRRWRNERSEEHTSELQSLMRISYAVFCLQKKNRHPNQNTT